MMTTRMTIATEGMAAMSPERVMLSPLEESDSVVLDGGEAGSVVVVFVIT